MLKRIYHKIKGHTFSQELLIASLSFTLFAWALLIATPFDIITSNLEEYTSLNRWELLQVGLYHLLWIVAALFFLYTIFLIAFSEIIRKFLFCFIISISLCVWLNSTFLVGSYGELDGRGNLQIEPLSALSWIQIATFVIAFVGAVSLMGRVRLLSQVVLSFLLVAFLTGIINALVAFGNVAKTPLTKTNGNDTVRIEESFHTYSKNNPNILLVLLDELMWSNVFPHLDKGRFLFLIYFYEGVFNEKTKDI